MAIPETTVDALLERYDAFLVDAYGVLVATAGALPGAARFVERLRAEGKTFVLLSNDASRLPSTAAARYREFGVPIDEADILCSGLLLADWFAARGRAGARCIVLGTDDSVAYVERAGGVVVARDDEQVDVVVVADDDGYPFLPGIEEVITTLFRKLDRGEPVELLLPNPDLIYPKDARSYGLGSGSVALVIERALSVRYPGRRLEFVGLGKPHAPIFEAALRRTGGIDRRRVVVLGDQLPTDIRGARDAGIDSVLVGTGLTRIDADLVRADVRPTWLLPALQP